MPGTRAFVTNGTRVGWRRGRRSTTADVIYAIDCARPPGIIVAVNGIRRAA